MSKSIENFLEIHLKEIGIKSEDYVLDFGCGKGNYAMPAAGVVGEDGKIYAIDEDKSKLEELKACAEKYELDNRFHFIQTDGKFNFPIEKESIDFTLLYNVTCCILGKEDIPKFQDLIEEIYRITKIKGKITIGIKEGKTMMNRIETAIPYIQDYFILEKKEKGKYFDGEKLRYGLFYFLSKK